MEPLTIALLVWETGALVDDPRMVFFAVLLVGLLEATIRQPTEGEAEI